MCTRNLNTPHRKLTLWKWAFLSLYLLSMGVLLFVHPENSNGPSHPSPTEQWFHREDETGRLMNRLEYFESMHRAGPDVDWRKMERMNVEAARSRRKKALENRDALEGAGRWEELGSRNQAGRIHVAGWSVDHKHLYAGADRGGLWKADPNGKDWTPMSDNRYGGVHEIGVVPALAGDPDILILLFTDWWEYATVHRSTDEGLTWSVPDGLGDLSGAKRILVLKDQAHTVFLLVKMEGKWQVLVSTDRGSSFEGRRELSKEGDIWTPRTYSGPVYLADQTQIFQTTDLGLTWDPVGNPIPKTFNKVILAGSEAPNLRFNAALRVGANWKLWRSEDAALSWKKVADIFSYYDYWQTLEASTVDGDLICYAGTELFFSRDGGGQWNKINPPEHYRRDPARYLHVDNPGVFALPDPEDPEKEIWYIGTDGGLYDSHDQLHSVRNLSLEGLGVSQYYGVLTSRRDPDLVLAGSQDQGYQRADLELSSHTQPGPWADFVQMLSGDYGHLVSFNGAHDLVYSVYPGFILVQEGELNPTLHYPFLNFPPNESYPWMPFIQADPLDPESFYFCARKLYRYTRVSGPTWSHVQHSLEDFSPGFLTHLAFSPLDANRAYAVTSDGWLYYSVDGAVTWTLSADTGPGFMQFYGTAMMPSSIDAAVCWVGGSGYSNAPVFRTKDGGVTWQPESDGLPSTLVYCLAEAPDQSGRMFCGSENGAWVYDPDTRSWSDLLGMAAPLNTYWACEAVPAQNLIRFGTYGRGIWDYHLETAGFFPYGELLGGANVLLLGNASPPLVGKTSTFLIKNCKPNAKGVLAYALAPYHRPSMGGTLLVLPKQMATLPFQAEVNGQGAVGFSLPSDPSLVGMELFFQAGALDPEMSQGVALSHGLKGVVGE